MLLNNSLNDLKDGGNKLLDGAATLKDGQSRMSDAIIKFYVGFPLQKTAHCAAPQPLPRNVYGAKLLTCAFALYIEP